jgi:hypothetical protein
MEVLAALGNGGGDFPTERACDRALSLPVVRQTSGEYTEYAPNTLTEIVGVQ